MKKILWIMGLVLLLTACGKEKEEEEEIISKIKDHEGNEYVIKYYGTQLWMAENMRCITTKSGTNILKWPANGQFSYEEPMAYYYVDKANNSLDGKGCLYNFAAAREICPDGWRLPTVEDWNTLMDYIDRECTGVYNDDVVTVAKAMASKGGWHSCDSVVGAPGYHSATNNTSKFNLLPVGNYITPTGEDVAPDFYNGSWRSTLWSSSVENESEGVFPQAAYIFEMLWSKKAPVVRESSTFQALSVRCVKDDEPEPDVTTDPNTITDPNTVPSVIDID